MLLNLNGRRIHIKENNKTIKGINYDRPCSLTVWSLEGVRYLIMNMNHENMLNKLFILDMLT